MKMNKYLTLIKILTLIGVTSSVVGAVQKCHPIRLQNGRARVQRQGRLVRFRCLKGYEFVGRRYMNCFMGQWDFERDPSVNPPMCVKPGCRASSYVNGHFLETYKGAVVSVVCNLGYTLIGSSTVYCNGYEWNQPFPECKAVDPMPPKSCDFEDGLCGWTQEPHGDWRWHKGEESAEEREGCNATDSGKRPPYECGNLSRYVLLGDSSSRIAVARKRLFSPVFPPEYSSNSCFAFWFTMNGLTAGYLKVFVKPEGAELDNTIPPFWVNGHQGYSWLPGYFPLYPSEAPFQVVIEGMSLPGNASEIAFDHANIFSGKNCSLFRQTYLSYLPFTSTIGYTETSDDDSTRCEDLCRTTASNSTGKCGCSESCLAAARCCVEYELICNGEVTATTEISTTTAQHVTDDTNEIPKHVEDDTYRSSKFTTAVGNEGTRTKSTASAAATTKTTAAPRWTDPIKFPLQVDPSHSSHVSKMRLDGKIAGGRLRGEDSPLSITSEGDRSTPTSSSIPSGTVEAVVAVAAVVACGIFIAAFIRRRRRRKTEKESMVEDSDVRFLTSDEFLDFTLARPADDDL